MIAPTRVGAVDIETWTEDAIASISTLHISAVTSSSPPRGIRGTSITLDIPLDEEHPRSSTQPLRLQSGGVNAGDSDGAADARANMRHTYVRRREPVRRDSQRRRELLLKGKEGSRRRQKWENDHLLGNPWAEPPLPSDWEIRPTYPVHKVPYFLAPLWNEREAQAKLEHTRQLRHAAIPEDKRSTNLPRELKAKLKRAKGAKQLLQELEEQIRDFVQTWDEAQRQGSKQPIKEDPESDFDGETYTDEEDEIVFVGRKRSAAAASTSQAAKQAQLEKDKMIFGSPADDNGASFGRWLVHSLAVHYNLRTWSITHGNPARREAFVGIPDVHGAALLPGVDGYKLPRPLWVSL